MKAKTAKRHNPKQAARILWMRLGDQGDYEEAESPHSAGETVGSMFRRMPDIRWHSEKGVEVGHFAGDDYISLYWGDKDAQPVAGARASLTQAEREEFERGVEEGLGEAYNPTKALAKRRLKRPYSLVRASRAGLARHGGHVRARKNPDGSGTGLLLLVAAGVAAWFLWGRKSGNA